MKKHERFIFACFLFLSISCGDGSSKQSGSNSTLSWSYTEEMADVTNKVTVCKRLLEEKAQKDRVRNIIKGLFNVALSAIPVFKVDLGDIGSVITNSINAVLNATTTFSKVQITDNFIFKNISADCDPKDIKIDALTEMVKDIYSELATAIADIVESDAKQQGSEVASAISDFNRKNLELSMNPEFYYMKDGKEEIATYSRECENDEYLNENTKCKFTIDYKSIPKTAKVKKRFNQERHAEFIDSMVALTNELKEFKASAFSNMLKPRENPSTAGLGANLPLLTQAISMTIFPSITYGLNVSNNIIKQSIDSGETYIATNDQMRGYYKDLSDTLYNMVYDAQKVIINGVDLKDLSTKDSIPQIYPMSGNSLPLFKIRDRKQGGGSNKDSASDETKEWGIDDKDNNWHSISEFKKDKKGKNKRETRYYVDRKDWEDFEIMIDEDDAGVPYIISVLGVDHGYKIAEGKFDLRGRTFKVSLPLEGAKRIPVGTNGKGPAVELVQFDVDYYESNVFKQTLRKALVKMIEEEQLDDKSGADGAKKQLESANEDYDLVRWVGGTKDEGRSLDNIMTMIQELAKAVDGATPKKQGTRPDVIAKILANIEKTKASNARPDKK